MLDGAMRTFTSLLKACLLSFTKWKARPTCTHARTHAFPPTDVCTPSLRTARRAGQEGKEGFIMIKRTHAADKTKEISMYVGKYIFYPYELFPTRSRDKKGIKISVSFLPYPPLIWNNNLEQLSINVNTWSPSIDILSQIYHSDQQWSHLYNITFGFQM